jgi:6,7-dimethyl-8-ribityllumazine synthase
VRVAIVVSEYHVTVTAGLERGARAALGEAGLTDVERIAVPGAFEIPQAAQRLAESGRFAAVICLGCLIRGETPHFDYIAQAVSHGLMRAAQATRIPITFGVLTTNTMAEAMARAGADRANKGREAAEAAVAMGQLYRRFERGAGGGSDRAHVPMNSQGPDDADGTGGDPS